MSNIINHSFEEKKIKQAFDVKTNQHLMNVSLLSKLNSSLFCINDNIDSHTKYSTAFKPMMIDTNDVLVNQIPICPSNQTIIKMSQMTQKEYDVFQKSSLEFYSVNTQQGENNTFLSHKKERDKEEEDKEQIVKSAAVYKHYSAPVKLLSKHLFPSQPLEKEKEKETSIDEKETCTEGINCICAHTGCGLEFKTKKQNLTHHIKMNNECHCDTITLLKSVSNIKRVLILLWVKISKINKEEIINKYESVIRNISIEGHASLITGLKFCKKE